MIGAPDSPAQRFPQEAHHDWEESTEVVLSDSGYVQAVESAKLMRLCRRHGLCVQMIKRPGDFVGRGVTVARVRGLPRERQRLLRQLSDVFIMGIERTQQQDVAFVFDQLVEIAIRALSSAINDSFTAIRCIDRLSDALSAVAQTPFPSPYRHDADGVLRVVTQPVNFRVLVSQVLYPIAESASGRTGVILRLFRAVDEIAEECTEQHQRAVLGDFLNYLESLSTNAPSAFERGTEIDAHRLRARRAIA